MIKRGLFLGRFQPFHIGHLSVVKEMDQDQDIDEILILIGSSQESKTFSNPFTVKEREEIIKSSLKIRKSYKIFSLPDFQNHELWFNQLVSTVPKFQIVYTESEFLCEYLKDKGFIVEKPVKKYQISATEIRNLIKENKQSFSTSKNYQRWIAPSARKVLLKILKRSIKAS